MGTKLEVGSNFRIYSVFLAYCCDVLLNCWDDNRTLIGYDYVPFWIDKIVTVYMCMFVCFMFVCLRFNNGVLVYVAFGLVLLVDSCGINFLPIFFMGVKGNDDLKVKGMSRGQCL